MFVPRKILVTIKNPWQRGTPSAVRKAVQLAKACKGQLEIFHALTAPIQLDLVTLRESSVEAFQHEQRADALRQLAKIARRVRVPGLEIDTHVEIDAPAYEATIRRANKIHADLIVADAHRGRHTTPWNLLLTDWELLRHSPIPVLLIKTARSYSHAGVLAAIDPSHAHAKTDQLDQDILAAGVAISRALRGKLHAMHAFVPLPAGIRPAELTSRGVGVDLEHFTEMAALRRFRAALGSCRIPSARRYLSSEHPDASIPLLAAKIHCGLVVMGAVSRSGFRRLFIGNTAERVLDALPCDVLVIKPRQFKSGVRTARNGVAVIAPPLPMVM